MSKKVVVTEEMVAKVTPGSRETYTGEVQKKITVQLKSGDRIVMVEGSVEYQRVGLFLKQGDIMSFEATGIRPWSFKNDEDKDVHMSDIEGLDLSTLVVKPGLWDEKPFEGLEGRSACTSFAPPRARTAAPVSGQGQFTAQPHEAEAGTAATGTTGGPEM